MKVSKQTYLILTLILVALLGFVLFPSLSPLLEKSGLLSQPSQPPLLSSESSVSQIAFARSSEADIVLTKTDTSWQVGEYQADLEAVNNLLASLTTTTYSPNQIISTNPDNLATFGLAESTAVTLTLTTPNQNLVYSVGKSGSQSNTFYLKKSDDPTVYLLSGNLRTYIDFTAPMWRDKFLAQVPTTNISQIVITSSQGRINLTKAEDGSWNGTSAGRTAKIGDNTISSLLNTLNPLEADGFAAEETTQTYQNLTDKITFEVYNSQEQTELVITAAQDPNKGQYLGVVNSNPEVIIFDQPTGQSLFLKPSDIF